MILPLNILRSLLFRCKVTPDGLVKHYRQAWFSKAIFITKNDGLNKDKPVRAICSLIEITFSAIEYGPGAKDSGKTSIPSHCQGSPLKLKNTESILFRKDVTKTHAFFL